MVGAKGLAVAVAGAFRPDTPEGSGSSRPAQENCSVRRSFSLGGPGRGVSRSVAVERLRVRADRADRGDETWFRLSLQVQAIDPRRNRDEQS